MIIVYTHIGTTGQSRIIFEGGYTIQVLDSPNTTSATTYKLQTKLGHTTPFSARIRVNRNNVMVNQYFIITLTEFSA